MICKNIKIGTAMVYLLPLVLAATAACPAIAQVPAIMPSHTPVVGPASTVAALKMRKTMDDMHEQMAQLKMSGDVDRDFVLLMKAHHQSAIEMAQTEVDSGKDGSVIKTAKKIILVQKKEIVAFDEWLKKHPIK